MRENKAKEFKVGDKVVRNYNDLSGTGGIGVVINITPQRKDVVVDFGNFKETFRHDGWSKGKDPWTASIIELLTPEIESRMAECALIRRCKKIVERANINPDQARQIIKIIMGDDAE